MPSDIAPSAAAPKRPNWALRAALLMLAAGACALLYVLFAASSKPVSPEAYSRLAKGEMASLTVLEDAPPLPQQALTDAAGRSVRLQDLRGADQVLVVNLWATWCAPCLEEMPTLAALQRRFGDQIAVLPVSVDGDADRARAIAELKRLSGDGLPFLNDPSRAILFSARANGMPITLIYDRRGREVARLAGGADWAGDDAAAVIEAARAEP